MLFYSLTFLSGGVFFIKKRLQFLPFWASIRTKQKQILKTFDLKGKKYDRVFVGFRGWYF